MAGEQLSWCAREVRQHDRDRFLVSLFVPAGRRELAFALAAFNNELARARETVSEPMLGAIRLQWWRESIAGLAEGDVRAHPVLTALAAPVREGLVAATGLLALIDARERDLDDVPYPDMTAYRSHAAATGGAFAALLAAVIGAPDERTHAAATAAGTAYALVGQLRALPHLARQSRVGLPADRIAALGVRTDDVLAGRAGEAVTPLVAEIVGLARTEGTAARAARRDLPRTARPALLFATLADLHARRLLRAGGDPWRLPARVPSTALRLWWAVQSGR